MPASLQEWIARDSIPFSPNSVDSLNAAIDRLLTSPGSGIELLAFGEAMHGSDEQLILRNRIFQRLVESHGYRAITIESSFPRGRVVDAYIAGQAGDSFDAIAESGFSHGFGKSKVNRELIEWMRAYNADPSHDVKLRFDGFDSPTEMTGTDSPRPLIRFALDYLTSIDGQTTDERRARIEELLGNDADWENPAAMMDPSKGVGLSPAATALRIEVQDLITHLQIRRPELVAKSKAEQFEEAEHYATHARLFLDYHAGLARPAADRIAVLLGMRDLMMANNLAYIARRERARGGKTFAFAHNGHVRLGQMSWQLGPHALTWWPAGALVRQTLGSRYAVIGSAIGQDDAQGIGQPEPGTLEAMLIPASEPGRFIPTRGVDPALLTGMPVRSGSAKNSTYFPLNAQSLSDFDWLAIVNS